MPKYLQIENLIKAKKKKKKGNRRHLKTKQAMAKDMTCFMCDFPLGFSFSRSAALAHIVGACWDRVVVIEKGKVCPRFLKTIFCHSYGALRNLGQICRENIQKWAEQYFFQGTLYITGVVMVQFCL